MWRKDEKNKTEWKKMEVRAWKCEKCDKEIINPTNAQKALEIEKARDKNF